MSTRIHSIVETMLPLVLVACITVLTGCATQKLDFSTVQQGRSTAATHAKHFQESGYSVYMLFDLIPVSPVEVKKLVQKGNPDNKPVSNLKVTSQADIAAVLLNLLNGGVIDRGVIVSLNKVTVEGDIEE